MVELDRQTSRQTEYRKIEKHKTERQRQCCHEQALLIAIALYPSMFHMDGLNNILSINITTNGAAYRSLIHDKEAEDSNVSSERTSRVRERRHRLPGALQPTA